MYVSAWEVRGGLGQRYGGHIMCLEFIPVRNVVQQSCLQLYQDLREDTEVQLDDSSIQEFILMMCNGCMMVKHGLQALQHCQLY